MSMSRKHGSQDSAPTRCFSSPPVAIGSIGGKAESAESQREMLGHLQGAESFSTWDVPGTRKRGKLNGDIELSMLKYVEYWK